MITLLIADSDYLFIKNIISKIIRKNDKIRLIDIVTSTKETLDICKSNKPDVILINTDLIDVSKFNDMNYKPNLLLFTDSVSKANENNYLLKSSNYELINKHINSIIAKNNLYVVKKELIHIFEKLKFNFSRNGTNLLIESILYSYENKHLYVYENLEKNVYPEIAKKHNISAYNVKWVIIKSVNEMYDRNYIENSLDVVSNFFNFATKIKPTAKVIISTILFKLENQCNIV